MDTKRELARFRAYDYEGIEKHLEEMALDGWMLASTGNYSWKYEKCEPAAVKFSVQYRENGGSIFAYSSGNEEEERQALEKAEDKGWKYIDTWSNVRIFHSKDEHAEPLYDDTKEKLEDCRGIVKKTGIGLPAVFALLVAFIGYDIVSDVFKYPLDSLSSWSHIIAAITVLFVFLVIIINLAASILWLQRAGKSPEPKINTRRYQILDSIQYVLLAITAIAFMLMVNKEDGAGSALESAGYMLLVILLIAGLSVLFSKLKKKKIGTAGWVGIALATFIAVFAVLMGYQSIFDDDDESEAVTIPDYAASYEDIAGNKMQEIESSYFSDTESGLVRMIRLDEYGAGNEQLIYYIAEVKNEKMYDWFFQKALMEDKYTWQEFLPAEAVPDSLWKEQDDTDWGVDKVFRVPGDDRWILQKDNMIMYLELDFEPKDSQKAGIVKKLEETASYED